MAKIVRKSGARGSAGVSVEGATKAAQAIAQSLAKSRRKNEGISVQVHIGDLYLIGFDEAIDAEEWGARELASPDSPGGGRGRMTAEERAEAQRKTKRRLNFKKGAVEITAVEDSEPVQRRRSTKAKAKAKAARPSRRARRKAR